MCSVAKKDPLVSQVVVRLCADAVKTWDSQVVVCLCVLMRTWERPSGS